jgi:hypothetical protein
VSSRSPSALASGRSKGENQEAAPAEITVPAANVRLRSTAVLQVLGSGGGSEIAESRAAGLTR